MVDKVGFVGLGNMGGPMARNLLKAGVKVVVHDLDPRKVELPKFELSDFAARAFELAAVAEKKYDGLVVRGERVVASVRGTEHVSVPAPTLVKPPDLVADRPLAKVTFWELVSIATALVLVPLSMRGE